jgi:hypothetical protein
MVKNGPSRVMVRFRVHGSHVSWDVVNVVVDPQAVDLSIAAPCVVFRNP